MFGCIWYMCGSRIILYLLWWRYGQNEIQIKWESTQVDFAFPLFASPYYNYYAHVICLPQR